MRAVLGRWGCSRFYRPVEWAHLTFITFSENAPPGTLRPHTPTYTPPSHIQHQPSRAFRTPRHQEVGTRPGENTYIYQGHEASFLSVQSRVFLIFLQSGEKNGCFHIFDFKVQKIFWGKNGLSLGGHFSCHGRLALPIFIS